MAEIRLAKTAGFCFGVDRAVKMVEDLLSQGKKVTTLGPIIHNQQVTDDFLKRGVKIADFPEDVSPDSVLVFRAHGVTKEILEKTKELGLTYADAVCPFVKKIHKIVIENSDENTVTVIAGDPLHPEVKGIKSYAKGLSFVVTNSEELENLLKENDNFKEKTVIFVSQTTFSVKEWEKSLKKLNLLCTNAKIFDTICFATEERQKEADSLSKQSDLMIVVGGRHSSNTKKLFDVCKKNCSAFLVETPSELLGLKFDGIRSVGVTAGASTPAGIIKEVLKTMSEIVNDNKMIEEEKVQDSVQASEDFDFEAALEESLSSMNSDQKVSGTVIGVTNTEIQVDIGRKQTGYVPYDEYSNDQSADPKAELKPGDTLNLIIMKTNDQEGTIMLSKKRYDAIKAWDDIVSAENDNTVLTGVVTDVIRGGVLVFSNNIRVFIPASLATMSRNDKLEDLLNKEVQFKIIEVDRRRRRVKGSVRSVLKEQRKAAAEKFWENAPAAGDKVEGVVKSLTAFGAFVDIGGVDGLVHISDLSWNKISHPSEVVNVGDKIEVTIKSIDDENKKISLGYKKAEDNPWEIMKRDYPVGTVCDVTIANFTTFGAFAHVIPRVDGLIHISEIANKRIAKPSDVLKIGETVQAKIIAVDFDNKKVSLSIKALLPEEPAEEAAEIAEAPAEATSEETAE